MGYLVIFGFFSFRRKMNILLCFIFRFRSKNAMCVGSICYVRNWTVTKFCDIGTGDFRFGPNGILCSSAFSFKSEHEKCIFGRPLHQTVSDYTLRQWFSNTQQSRFRTACRCLEKLVLPSIFWHKSSFIIIVASSEWTVAPLRGPWQSQISTA